MRNPASTPALIETGIPGLDDVLAGGLPSNRRYLIVEDLGRVRQAFSVVKKRAGQHEALTNLRGMYTDMPAAGERRRGELDEQRD